MKKLLLIIAAVAFVSCSSSQCEKDQQKADQITHEINLKETEISDLLFSLEGLEPGDFEGFQIEDQILILKIEIIFLEEDLERVKKQSRCI